MSKAECVNFEIRGFQLLKIVNTLKNTKKINKKHVFKEKK